MQLDLEKIRGMINGIDDEIVELYKKRLALCDEVAEYKISTGKAVLDRSREDKIIERLTEKVAEKDKGAVAGLYKRIFEISRARQSAKVCGINEFYSDIREKAQKNTPFPMFTTGKEVFKSTTITVLVTLAN